MNGGSVTQNELSANPESGSSEIPGAEEMCTIGALSACSKLRVRRGGRRYTGILMHIGSVPVPNQAVVMGTDRSSLE